MTCDIDLTSGAAVGFDEDGNFAVAWEAPRSGNLGGPRDIYIRRFYVDGDAIGDAVSLTDQAGNDDRTTVKKRMSI